MWDEDVLYKKTTKNAVKHKGSLVSRTTISKIGASEPRPLVSSPITAWTRAHAEQAEMSAYRPLVTTRVESEKSVLYIEKLFLLSYFNEMNVPAISLR